MFSTRKQRRETGMVTSEYAVGTVGSCGVAGALIALTQTDWFNNFITSTLDKIANVLPF